MNKAIYLLMVFGSINSSGQKGITTAPTKPYITPAGDPFGDIVSEKIGIKGGKLLSADKGLEVLVPANALENDTTFSIQSIHNELNENDEGAYKLEPSGIQFKKPVQLIFHYADENAEIKSIAWQGDHGEWHKPAGIVLDTIQKTISCVAPHFCTWSRFDKLCLDASSLRVKVNRTVTLTIRQYLVQSDADLLSAPGNPDFRSETDNEIPSAYSADWTVNGIKPGSDEVGFATRQDNITALYKAPAIPPESNPVAVSVQIYSNNNYRKLLLTSHITVIGDQYHFTFIHIDEKGCYFLVDSSSCILNMKKHDVTISNIKNYPPWSDWPPSCDGCRWQWTNKESLKGLVEITGIASSQITPPGDGHPDANVNVIFSPATGNTPTAVVTCPRAPTVTVPTKTYPASPREINFDIDGDEVIIHAAGKTGRNELVIEGDKQKTMIYIYKVN